MKKLTIKHLGFILLSLILTACNNVSISEHFLGDKYFYYKSNTLNIYSDLDPAKEATLEELGNTVYSQRYKEDIKDIEISPDGRYLYYISYKNSSDNSGKLICEDLYFDKIQKEKVKKQKTEEEEELIKNRIIAVDVSSFDMLYSGRVLYYEPTERTLSVWNGKDSSIIDSKVEEYKVDYYENTLIYTIKKGEYYNLYSYSINIDGTTSKLLDEEITKLIDTSKSFDNIYYTKEESGTGILCCMKYLNNINRITDGNFIDFLINSDTGNIYFTKSNDEYSKDNEYGTLYYYSTIEEELMKVIDNVCIKDIIEGRHFYDMVIVKTPDKNYFVKSNDVLEFNELENIKTIYSRPEDMTLFYLSNGGVGDKYDLYSISAEGSELNSLVTIDRDVESIDRLYVGKVYYYKKSTKGRDLYRSGTKLRANVEKTFYLYGSIYMACDKKEKGFALYRTWGDKIQFVDSGVHSFRVVNMGYVMYIKNFENKSGDLYLWNGKNPKLLDKNVLAVGNEFSLNRDVYEKE